MKGISLGVLLLVLTAGCGSASGGSVNANGNGKGADNVPPSITDMVPVEGSTFQNLVEFSATVTDETRLKSVVITVVTPSGFNIAENMTQGTGDKWTYSLTTSNEGQYSWFITAKDNGPRGGNTTTSPSLSFTIEIDNGGGGGGGGGGETEPSAPTSLTAVPVSTSEIGLTWTDTATNEDGFRIERSSDGVTFSALQTINTPNASSYNDTGLTASTQYYYRVFAFNSVGDSTSPSNTANATTNSDGGGSGGGGGGGGVTFGPYPPEVPTPFPGWNELPDCLQIEGINPNGPLTSLNLTLDSCAIRNVHFTGWRMRITGANFAIIDSSFTYVDRTILNVTGENIVIYNTEVAFSRGNDRHCIQVGGGSSNVWIYKNVMHDCSGDGFQSGHLQVDNRPSNVYLVQNIMYDNRENGLDYKFMQNVYAAENVIFDHFNAPSDQTWCPPNEPDPAWCSTSTSGSDGSGIVIGSDGAPINTYHYRNEIYSGNRGIRIEDAEGDIVLDGNIVHDINDSCLQLDKLGIGVQYRNNQCVNAGRGIFQNWRDQFGLDVVNNYFNNISGPAIEYEQGQVVDRSTLVDNTFEATGPVIYNNTVATTQEQINALPRASGNIVVQP